MTTPAPRPPQRRRFPLALLALGGLLLAAGLAEAASRASQPGPATKTKASEHDKLQARLSVSHSSSLAADQQQEQLSRLSSISAAAAASGGDNKSPSVQVSADKKQGDSRAESMSSAAESSALEEYVQIKPEEVGDSSPSAKDLESSGSEVAPVQQQQQQQQSALKAEHKSADDELSAQLAPSSPDSPSSAASAETLSQQESAQKPQAADRSAHQHHHHHYGAPLVMRPPPMMMRPAHYSGHPMVRAPPRRPMHHQGGRGLARHPMGRPVGPRMPPSYVTLKGKLTGINSLISQYPHPAPGYPHQVPRHLPRGAAAGYAAFRDFVRAHASKYKQPSASLEGPQADPYRGAAAAASGGQYGVGKPAYPLVPAAPVGGYQQQQHGPSGNKAFGGGPKHGAKSTKVTIAQAYIPHLPAPAAGDYQQGDGYSAGAAANPMLAKLYGGHAPQGVGRPEYSKDYGMVIHYPQATVYTEPMTVDQLHKLTGAGISQVLAQLQHNLANGHRDESNTIRSNNHHHLGHGLTIHAKEYYAPDKGGRYVPTTAAIISAAGAAAQPAAGESSYGAGAGQSVQLGPVLGTGYERVKAAVAASQGRYNTANAAHTQAVQTGSGGASGDYGQPQGSQYQTQGASGGYGASEPSGGSSGQAAAAKPYSNGEPLSSITNLLGHELEALYKANAALNKHLDPEIQSTLAAYAKNPPKTPLRYAELDQSRPHLSLEHLTRGLRGYAAGAVESGSGKHNGPRLRLPRRHANRANRYPGRGHHHQQQQQQQQAQGYAPRPQQAGGYQGGPQQVASYGRPTPQQVHQIQQLQSYQAAEQALNNQMHQLLRDFHAGDDQYNGKSQLRTINQGYPHKVLQKQQAAYGQQQGSAYSQHEGLEIPQGPNDQIGEIAELIEALRGTLEAHRPEEGAYSQKHASANNLDDVRYLAAALGQTPSYAVQVPVSSGGEEAAKKGGAYQEQQQLQQQYAYQSAAAAQPASNDYGQQQQVALGSAHQAGSPAYQQAASADGYTQQQQQQHQAAQQQQAAAYGPQAAAYGGQQQVAAYVQPQQQYQPNIQAEYAAAVQQVTADGNQAQYGPLADGSGAPAASGGAYAQPEQAPAQPVYQQQQQQHSAAPATSYQQPAAASYQQQPASSGASGYTSTEHSHVIDHLVPLGQQQQAQAQQTSDYEAPSGHQSQQQPAHQIAVAAPTDAQYQQAQSLSSFVDSLPTDYQELLRQPALDAGSSGHLAALGQEASATSSGGYSSSTYTTSATVTAPSTVQSTANYDAAQQQSSYSGEAQQQHHHHQQQQTYSGAEATQQPPQPAQYRAKASRK